MARGERCVKHKEKREKILKLAKGYRGANPNFSKCQSAVMKSL
jgi:ribosomal protein L20